MRRSVTPIILGFVLLMIAFVYLAQAVFIVQLIGKVDKVEGDAEVQRQGKGPWFHLEEEHYVRTGDMVRTKEDSRAEIRWLDGTRVRVEPNTRLKIKKCSMNTLKKSKRSEFRLDVGKLWIRIIETLSSDSKFEVTTPTTTAAVRGTVFSVEVDAAGATSISVYGGTVAVATRRPPVPVGEGLAVSVPSADAAPRPAAQTLDETEQWQKQVGIITPALHVRQPAADGVAQTAQVTVKGTVEPAGILTINEQNVQRTRGKRDEFEHTLTLQPGLNTIIVKVTDPKGISTEVVRRLVFGSLSNYPKPGAPSALPPKKVNAITPAETAPVPPVTARPPIVGN